MKVDVVKKKAKKRAGIASADSASSSIKIRKKEVEKSSKSIRSGKSLAMSRWAKPSALLAEWEKEEGWSLLWGWRARKSLFLLLLFSGPFDKKTCQPLWEQFLKFLLRSSGLGPHFTSMYKETQTPPFYSKCIYPSLLNWKHFDKYIQKHLANKKLPSTFESVYYSTHVNNHNVYNLLL